jgi:hypothetical protein
MKYIKEYKSYQNIKNLTSTKAEEISESLYDVFDAYDISYYENPRPDLTIGAFSNSLPGNMLWTISKYRVPLIRSKKVYTKAVHILNVDEGKYDDILQDIKLLKSTIVGRIGEKIAIDEIEPSVLDTDDGETYMEEGGHIYIYSTNIGEDIETCESFSSKEEVIDLMNDSLAEIIGEGFEVKLLPNPIYLDEVKLDKFTIYIQPRGGGAGRPKFKFKDVYESIKELISHMTGQGYIIQFRKKPDVTSDFWPSESRFVNDFNVGVNNYIDFYMDMDPDTSMSSIRLNFEKYQI